MEKYEEAIESYNKAIALEPNYASTYNRKAVALSNLGRYEEAIQCYDKVLEINPNSEDAKKKKAMIE